MVASLINKVAAREEIKEGARQRKLSLTLFPISGSRISV